MQEGVGNRRPWSGFQTLEFFSQFFFFFVVLDSPEYIQKGGRGNNGEEARGRMEI